MVHCGAALLCRLQWHPRPRDVRPRLRGARHGAGPMRRPHHPSIPERLERGR